MNFDFEVIQRPDGEWLTRLHRGHWVWLTKQGEFARISSPYWQDPGCVAGEVTIERYSCDKYYKGLERWYVSPGGYGFDGKSLMEPVRNNVPSEPPRHPLFSKLLEVVDTLQDRILSLETQVMLLKAKDAESKSQTIAVPGRNSIHTK